MLSIEIGPNRRPIVSLTLGLKREVGEENVSRPNTHAHIPTNVKKHTKQNPNTLWDLEFYNVSKQGFKDQN